MKIIIKFEGSNDVFKKVRKMYRVWLRCRNDNVGKQKKQLI